MAERPQERSRQLRELGLADWRERAAAPAAPTAPADAASGAPADAPAKRSGSTLTLDPETARKWDWGKERRKVEECRLCELGGTRKNAVFGAGDQEAELMLVGEAPGASEDAQGEPFVGQAGRLLDAMLQAVGIARESVFITNILKCRPPGNANPSEEQIAQCRGHLHRQFELIQPKVVLALGAVAAQNLLGREDSIGELRGQEFPLPDFDGVRVVATYHPAFLLRRSAAKAKAFEDLVFLATVLKRGR